MKHFLPILFISLAACSVSHAQIVLTSDLFTSQAGITMRSVDQTIVDSNINDQLVAIAEKDGTGQTWDISGFTYVQSGDTATSILIEGISTAPKHNNPALAKCNFVSKSFRSSTPEETDWGFMSLTDSNMAYHGVVVDYGNGTQDLFLYTPPQKVFQFPVSYGSSWTSTSSIMIGDSLGLPFDIFFLDSSIVDGEGTLVMPGGLSVECLRIKNMQLAYAEAPFDFFHDTSVSYNFISASGASLASISLNHSGVWSQFQSTAHVAYDQPIAPSGAVGPSLKAAIELSISPNPAIRTTELAYTLSEASQVTLTVTNELGAQVYCSAFHAFAGKNTTLFNTSGLPEGSYYVRLSADYDAASGKFVVIR